MSNDQNNTQVEQAPNEPETQETRETLSQIDGIVFGDVVAEYKTSLAFNGEARKNDEVHEVTLAVNLSGVTLKEALGDMLAQAAVKFQRTRRDKESNGVFGSKEAFDEYVESLDGTAELHYSNVGKAPQKPLSDQEAQAKADQFLAQMSPEARERFIEKRM